MIDDEYGAVTVNENANGNGCDNHNGGDINNDDTSLLALRRHIRFFGTLYSYMNSQASNHESYQVGGLDQIHIFEKCIV